MRQQSTPGHNVNLNHYETLEIIISTEKFSKTLNPVYDENELILAVDHKVNRLDLMHENFQSIFTIPAYGSVYAGELIQSDDKKLGEPLKIKQDYLLFTISFGGGAKEKELVSYKLIWDGEYYMTNDIPTVDLVLSFKDLDFHKAFIRRNISFDLLPLQLINTNQIYINFKGYDKFLMYEY